MQDLICRAIRNRRLIEFTYEGATRVVEPHQLGKHPRGLLILSAYWVGGYSRSMDTLNRWRFYLVSRMSCVVILDELFPGERIGYKRVPNKIMSSAVCEL